MAYSNNSILEGNELFIYDGSTAIAYATNSTLSINSETSEASHKDVDGGWESSEVTALSWSASSENLFTLTDYKTLFNKMIAKTAITLKFALPITVGSTTTYKGYTGTAYIESLEVNAPNGDNATYTVNFTGAGALTKIV